MQKVEGSSAGKISELGTEQSWLSDDESDESWSYESEMQEAELFSPEDQSDDEFDDDESDDAQPVHGPRRLRSRRMVQDLFENDSPLSFLQKGRETGEIVFMLAFQSFCRKALCALVRVCFCQATHVLGISSQWTGHPGTWWTARRGAWARIHRLPKKRGGRRNQDSTEFSRNVCPKNTRN